MSRRSIVRTIAVLFLARAVGAVAQPKAQKNLEDAVGQSAKAAQVFRELAA